MDTKIHRDEIFSMNRDELFVNRLCSDMLSLESIGMTYKDIKRTIGTFDYVKVWTRTPQWLYPKLRLPTGYRWKDSTKANGLNMLVIDNDLWLKPVQIPGTHKDDPEIGMVQGYKDVSPKDIANYLGNPFDAAIFNFYKELDIPLGYTVHSLSTIDERTQAKQMLVQSLLYLYEHQIHWMR